MSKPKTPLELAVSFVREVDALNSLPFMTASYDAGKYAICRELIELVLEHLALLRRIRDGHAPTATGASLKYEAMALELEEARRG